ncbi:hypothetical protein [Bacillus xiapuensis]|uniref:hypothetical protein n=1 Tax=Bacillus xiapuensis TaxID=2014075 RepID=UPI000C236DAB|nr:hypothetical protein [Bacillus xiapuensis]
MTTVMKWITGGLEAILAIPLVGGSIVIGNLWMPLGIMAVLHIITLLLSIKSGRSSLGSIFGIITSLIAWIPFLGWAMHVVTAFILIFDAFRDN